MSQPSSESPPDRRREIVLAIERRKRLGGARGDAFIRLLGSELTLVHPGVLVEPLVVPGGQVSVAAVDRGRSSGEHGRFAVLHRMSSGVVIGREHGIEGWLWTTRQGSALPALAEHGGDAPNLALVFTKRLGEAEVTRCFAPAFVRELAERSPLGDPAILGLLLTVADPLKAEEAFRLFGVLADLTDREVPPTMRRHLPGDLPANPAIARSDAGRAATSVAPPGF